MTTSVSTTGQVTPVVGLRLPPGPPGDLDLHSIRRNPLDFVDRLHQEYGDITSHTAGGDTVFMLNRADLAKYVLKDNSANYTKRNTPDEAMLRPLLGNGLLISSGQDWATQRRVCAPAFRHSEIARFDGIITDATAAMIRRWQPAVDTGTPVAMDHQLTALTLGIVVRAILSVDIDGIGDGFGRAVDAVNAYVAGSTEANPLQGIAGLSFVQAKGFLDIVTRTLVAGRRASGTQEKDLLAGMLAAGHALSDQDLLDQVLTLIMAGHETTAKSLTWTLYLLDQHPQRAQAIYDEVDRVLAGRVPTAADMPDLVITQAAVKEAMRLYPPSWLISRRAVSDDVIEGYHVPAGALVCVSQWVLHRDGRYWDHPAEFRPERFRNPTHPSHAYLPFGGGNRVCIGQHLALVEATLALAQILRVVRPRLVPGFAVEPEALVTLRPKFGMSMTLEGRS